MEAAPGAARRRARHHGARRGAGAALPAGMRAVSQAALESGDAAALLSARDSLRETGAMVLELTPGTARELAALLRTSSAVLERAAAAAGGPPPPVRALAEGKLLLEYRLNERLAVAAVPPHFERDAAGAYRLLTTLGHTVLSALCAASEPRRRVETASGEPLGHFLEFDPGPVAAGCSVLSLFRYAAGGGAAAHTDAGVLTFVFAAAPGLEVHTRRGGWQPLRCGAAQLAVLAGETLQYLTCHAVPPSLHRVAPGAPRHAAVMRLRAPPATPLPRGLGVFGRFATVADFERDFRDTHASVNAPLQAEEQQLAAAELGQGLGALSLSAAAAAPVPLQGESAADVVLRTPLLAGLILDALRDDTGRGLARAECLCASLRAAAAPRWHALCARRMGQKLLPPSYDPAGDVWRWRALHRRFTASIRLGFRMAGCHTLYFTVGSDTPFERIFSLYLAKARLRRDRVRFLIDGNRMDGRATPYDLELRSGEHIDALFDQVGD